MDSIGQTYRYVRYDKRHGFGPVVNELRVFERQVPAAPSSLAAAAASSTQVNLTWADNSYDETGFAIDRSTTSDVSSGVTTITRGANTTSYSDTGLTAGITYHYRIRATNNAGTSANSTSASATTTAAATATLVSTGGTAAASSAPVTAENAAKAFDAGNSTK